MKSDFAEFYLKCFDVRIILLISINFTCDFSSVRINFKLDSEFNNIIVAKRQSFTFGHKIPSVTYTFYLS
jgi:hypothetical protein